MEIEILDQDGSDTVINYFSNLFVSLTGKDFEVVPRDIFTDNHYKLIHIDTFLKIEQTKMSRFFLFYTNEISENSMLELKRIAKTNHECVGIFNINNDSSLYVPFVESFMGQMAIVDSQKNILKKLNGTIQSILGQLQRVKGFHEKVVPVRSESFRGFNINSRFCAGTASGGEFFDFFKSGQSLWLFSINASSYITIGTFLTLVEGWKAVQGSLTLNQVRQNLNSSKVEFEGLGDVSLLVLKIDLISMKMETLNIGGHEIIAKEKVVVARNEKSFPYSDVEEGESHYQLTRGEQVVILSPGYFKNTGDQIEQSSTFSFLKKNWAQGSSLIQELTFQSKRKYNDLDFLPYDQTIFTIGVDKNVITKA